jgi:hypothetical protein
VLVEISVKKAVLLAAIEAGATLPSQIQAGNVRVRVEASAEINTCLARPEARLLVLRVKLPVKESV